MPGVLPHRHPLHGRPALPLGEGEGSAGRGEGAVERRFVSRQLLLLLLAVLAVHLLMALVARNGIVRDDAESYVVLGRNLAHGHGYVFAPGRMPTAWRAPGYPVLLAGIFSVFGDGLLPGRLANVLLLTFLAFAGYGLAAAMLPRLLPGMSSAGHRSLALLTAGIIGFYPEYIGLTGLLWSENLSVPLFLSAVWALYVFSLRPEPKRALLCGLLIGVCMLTRSTAIILLPVIWVCALRLKRSGAAVRSAVLASAVAVLCVGSWSARNYMLMHKFILVESNVGFNLYLGHRPDTPIPFAWRRAESLPRDPLYKQLNAAETDGEKSAALSHAAFEQIKHDPLRTAILCVSKTFDFWLPDFFVAFNVRSGALGPEYTSLWKPVLGVSVLAYFVVMVPAVVGLARMRASWEARYLLLILALYTLPHALVYGLSRYHLPLMPLLILSAAPVLRQWFLSRSEARGRRSATPAHTSSAAGA